MLTKCLVGIAALLVILAIVAALQPPTYHVERSMTMNASPAAVFAQADDLRLYEHWNPFGRDDTTTVLAYQGPANGTGSAMTWRGTGSAGEGHMTIAETKPNEFVHYRLEFIKPFAGTAESAITIKSQGNQSVVTWSMDGENTFMSKLMGLFMGMDKMIGGFFVQGLTALKSIVEKT